MPSSSTTAGAKIISPTALSSRRRTIRPKTAASNTTRPTAVRLTPTSRSWIQDRANELLKSHNAGVNRVSYDAAIKPASTHQQDFVLLYVNDLKNVIDLEMVRSAQLKLGGRSSGRRLAALLGADQL